MEVGIDVTVDQCRQTTFFRCRSVGHNLAFYAVILYIRQQSVVSVGDVACSLGVCQYVRYHFGGFQLRSLFCGGSNKGFIGTWKESPRRCFYRIVSPRYYRTAHACAIAVAGGVIVDGISHIGNLHERFQRNRTDDLGCSLLGRERHDD